MDAADLEAVLKKETGWSDLSPEYLKRTLPRAAKDTEFLSRIAELVRHLPTHHRLHRADARDLSALPDESVHLVVTSPPYWNLKRYRENPGQLGHMDDYEAFLAELDKVWRECRRVLVSGGRLVIVVGDVCLSRKKHGSHSVVPLHASLQERCRGLGFENLAPIIWHKIANANHEVNNGSSFLGKPYEPNAVIKNDIEYILMQRRSGGYRKPTPVARVLSVIPEREFRVWYQQIWDLNGASTSRHPAPYPVELAERLIRMFSFVGDTVLDPFTGTATTNLAAARWGRNSIGFEVDPVYLKAAYERMLSQSRTLFGEAAVTLVDGGETTVPTDGNAATTP